MMKYNTPKIFGFLLSRETYSLKCPTHPSTNKNYREIQHEHKACQEQLTQSKELHNLLAGSILKPHFCC